MPPASPPPVSMSMPPAPTSSSSSKKFIPLIIGAVLIVILLVAAVTMMKGSTQKSPTEIKTQTPSPTQAQAKKKNPPSTFPQVTVSNWDVPAIAIAAPQTARIYTFKQDLKESDFRGYATNFFTVNTIDENDKRIVAYSTETGASMFYMQKAAGSFLFTSDKGVALAATGSASVAPAQITQFTQKVVNDPSVKLFAQYAKPNDSKTEYFEYHRDWSVMGLPILNLFGLFNIPSTTYLKDLNQKNTLQAGDTGSPKEFNTATVGVKDGKVTSFVSNLRPLAINNSSSPVIAFGDAVAKLKAGGYTYIYTSPAGTGSVDREKLYPQNKAVLTTATVTDATIAYLEDIPKQAQAQMIPYYIFRGTADTQSGYKVEFLAAVPAVTTGVLGASTAKTSLIAQNSQDEIPVGNRQSQQQGTLKFNEQGGVMQGATKYEEGLPVLGCDPPPDPSQLTDVQQDVSGIVFGRAQRDGDGKMEWYVVPEAGWDVEKLKVATDVVFKSVTSGAAESDDEKVRRIAKIVSDYEQQSAGCPVRVTGSSPTIFVYGTGEATIVPQSNVTYSEPALGAGWKVSGGAGAYLYYEYTPVSFIRPSAGWNVSRSDLNAFAGRLAKQLGLNAAETGRLTFELNHAAADVSGNNLFVGQISQTEVNAKLPLSVTGTSNITRLHFYVGRASANVSAPSVNPVVRSSFYVLELGASAQ